MQYSASEALSFVMPLPAHEGFCTHCVLESLQQVDGQQLLGVDPVPIKHLNTQCLCFGLLHHEPFALIPYWRQRVLLVLLQVSSLLISMLAKYKCCTLMPGNNCVVMVLQKMLSCSTAEGHKLICQKKPFCGTKKPVSAIVLEPRQRWHNALLVPVISSIAGICHHSMRCTKATS